MLVDQYGKPLMSPNRKRRRVPTPGNIVIGDVIGQWAGAFNQYLQLPGGTVLQFDLNKLTMDDFRQMRNNYQLSASLNVLTFMMHQLDWKIECDEQAIADMIEDNMRDQWTRLIRALSQAFWAGYSPSCIVYENNPRTGYTEISKFKDLVPEQCQVNWHEEDGVILPNPGSDETSISNQTPPKISSFDGIKHYPMAGAWGDGGHGPWFGGYGTISKPVVIPADNSLWYPLLMENGDYYGRKLLKPAFPPYYFSQLIHLFANRYYERYGEPTALGRADFQDDVEMVAGEPPVNGKKAMEQILMNLRNRSVVVLPSDRDPDTKEFDYTIEYLESQMRGADFERYLQRLDEEMSIAVFTPILLFRTSDVGSYNLGNIHVSVFQQMLNSIAGDMKEYIQRYVVDRLRVLNFGENSPKAEWKFRELGKGDMQTYQLMLQALVAGGIAKPSLEELSVATGITMEEIEQVAAPPSPSPVGTTAAAQRDLQALLGEAVSRFGREVTNGWDNDSIKASLGYRKRFEETLRNLGYDHDEAKTETSNFYDKANGFIKECLTQRSAFKGPEDVRDTLSHILDFEFLRFLNPKISA